MIILIIFKRLCAENRRINLIPRVCSCVPERDGVEENERVYIRCDYRGSPCGFPGCFGIFIVDGFCTMLVVSL